MSDLQEPLVAQDGSDSDESQDFGEKVKNRLQEREKYGQDLSGEDFDTLSQKVEDLQVEGWSILERNSDHVVMQRGSFGGIIAHVLLFCISFGILNVLYAWYKFSSTQEKQVVRP